MLDVHLAEAPRPGSVEVKARPSRSTITHSDGDEHEIASSRKPPARRLAALSSLAAC